MTSRAAVLLLTLALTACRAEPPRPPAAAPPVNADAKVQAYRCDDGAVVQAGYPDAITAVVTVGGHAYTLKSGRAASGVRYVGFGLQWWTKGPEARLSRLKDGEEVASDPGVVCRTDPAPAVEPPAPGTPGGLPDDRTPISEGPIDPKSAQGAGQVVQTYYALIGEHRYGEAWKLWADEGRASNQTPEAFAGSFARYRSYHAQIGAPGPMEGAAGSSYVEQPVVIYGAEANGKPFSQKSVVTLRRVNDVDGSTAEQRRWRIAKIEPAG